MSNITNVDSFGSPSPKRFRPENESPSDSNGSEDLHQHSEFDQKSSHITFRTKKLRPFNAANSQDECVVVSEQSGNTRRHLCSSPQYATAAGELYMYMYIYTYTYTYTIYYYVHLTSFVCMYTCALSLAR